MKTLLLSFALLFLVSCKGGGDTGTTSTSSSSIQLDSRITSLDWYSWTTLWNQSNAVNSWYEEYDIEFNGNQVTVEYYKEYNNDSSDIRNESWTNTYTVKIISSTRLIATNNNDASDVQTWDFTELDNDSFVLKFNEDSSDTLYYRLR